MALSCLGGLFWPLGFKVQLFWNFAPPAQNKKSALRADSTRDSTLPRELAACGGLQQSHRTLQAAYWSAEFYQRIKTKGPKDPPPRTHTPLHPTPTSGGGGGLRNAHRSHFSPASPCFSPLAARYFGWWPAAACGGLQWQNDYRELCSGEVHKDLCL